MNFFSEERTSELRELFFESAVELLQALNEAGLELEKRPADAEIIRTIRRTVHTLKGDSAACGFRDLSELAHELEDVLTPEIAARNDSSVAPVVLSAADVFDAMLAACRAAEPSNGAAPEVQSPDTTALREMIRGIATRTTPAAAPQSNPVAPLAPAVTPVVAAPEPPAGFEPKFLWSEYERLVIQQGAKGHPLFNIAVAIDPQCPFRAAGVQLVRNVLQEAGTVLLVVPEDGAAPDKIDVLEAVIASEQDERWITRKCHIPAVAAGVVVRPFAVADAQPAPAIADAASTLAEPTPASAPETAVAVDRVANLKEAATTAVPVAEPEVHEVAPAASHLGLENILRVDAERIDAVLNLVGEMIIGKSMLHQTVNEFARRFPKDPLRMKFADMLAHQAQVLNDLQRSVMKIRMVPVEQLFRRFPRAIRDVAKATGKYVNLELSGQDTDLDKSILDALAEPLMHLVRNAVDHGIETPDVRVTAGKPAQGTVRLSACHQGNQVVIEVSDDGRGIDIETIALKAQERGLVTADEVQRMSESEILELIFEPGFTTAPLVTEISGRGVGLDVVKTVLDRMKGAVSIHNRPGAGTTFQLKVPLTLAIIKALLFRAGQRLYAVPLGAVLEIARASEAEIHRVDQHEVLPLRGQLLTIIRLSRLGAALGNSEATATPAGVAELAPRRKDRAFIIVVAIAERKFGLLVDHLVGEEELVIKALDNHLVASELVSGASILGDGTVVLILNIAAIVETLGRIRSVSVAASSDVVAAPVSIRDQLARMQQTPAFGNVSTVEGTGAKA